MTPEVGLPAVNFFMADVGGGMGPFLSTWLAQVEHFSPARIGAVLSAGLIAGMLLSTPAGMLIDRFGQPRFMLVVTCLLIMTGTGAMFIVHDFWPILAAQTLVASGGALGAPALTALTLATVGNKGFPRQQGVNQAATHAGNVTAAAVIWGLSFAVGATASIGVLGVMAAGMLITLFFYPRDALDHTRMAGCKPRSRREERGSTWALLQNRRLIVLTLALGLFNLGNGAMLPLLGQRMALTGIHNPTQWMAILVIVAQAVMIPVSWAAGHSAERFGRRFLLLGACGILTARGVLAMISSNPTWLILIEVMDGVGAGLISVAGPAATADLTYGDGRTQTAMGAINTVQTLASALSAWTAGMLVLHGGWTAAFGVLAVVPLGGVALLLTIHLRDENPQQADRLA